MKQVILTILVVALIFCFSPVLADDYVDDVYYHSDVVLIVADTMEVRDVTLPEYGQERMLMEFLDDSITRQNPDTVVRMRISRPR
mgnify:CR=1 FL=1